MAIEEEVESTRTDVNSSENVDDNPRSNINIMSDIWDSEFTFQIPNCAISRVEVIDEEEQQFGIWSERLEAFIISLKYNDNGNHVNRVVEQIKPFAFGNRDTYFAYYYNMSIEKRMQVSQKGKDLLWGTRMGGKYTPISTK